MKFSLDAGGAQAVGQGIGSIFKALAMGPMYRQQAEDEALQSSAKLGAYEASAQASRAAANKNEADAALNRHRLSLQQNPMESALLKLGLPTALAPVFRQRLEIGSFGPDYEPPIDGMGPSQQPPATSEQVSELGRAISLMQRMYATESKVNQGTDAALDEQRQRGIDAVIANPALAGVYGKANAAAEGKSLFGNVGDSGYSIDNFTGQQASANPVLAKLFGDESGAKVARDRGAANSSNAAAGKYSAEAGTISDKRKFLGEKGSLPGAGAEGSEGALSSTVIRSMDIPVLDDKGRPVTDAYGKPMMRTDQDALKRFYGWATESKRKPTATAFAQWEAQGRPGNKDPAGPQAASKIEPAPPSGQRKSNTVYETPKGPMRWTGTGWLPAN